MDVAAILAPGSIRCSPRVSSKKSALEVLSTMLADAAGGIDAGTVLDGLAAREKLGSTGLGSAVAMPHARASGIEHSVGAFLRLDEPVEFDSPDGKAVDLLFGLLVPESATPEEVQEVRDLVKKLRDATLQGELRRAGDDETLYQLLTDGMTTTHPAPALSTGR
jgi:PTS system nitrogen regulatory IIA component